MTATELASETFVKKKEVLYGTRGAVSVGAVCKKGTV